MCSRDDDPTQHDHLEDQPPVPGGTTAIRDGQYVTEERAPGPPDHDPWIRCPVCADMEHQDDMIGGICLTCADAVAFAQNARRGAVVVDPGPPRGPDTTRDPRNPRKPAAADDPRLDGWNARTIREEFYEDGQRIMPTDKRAAPAEGHDVERVIDIWVKWKRGIDPRTFPEYLRAAIKEASDG